MKIELRAVQKGRDGQALPATTVEFESGRATLARAETEQRPTVLGLIASGRMKPDAGAVLLDGKADRRGIRRRIALVDAPDVCDPAPDVTVAGVAAEELMFTGIPATPRSVSRWLRDLGLGRLSRVPIANVAPEDRLRLLTELAVLRDDVEGLVIVAPDRHGGDPVVWWSLAKRLADRGYAVLVVAGDASAAAIGAAAMLDRMRGDDVDDGTGDSGYAPMGVAATGKTDVPDVSAGGAATDDAATGPTAATAARTPADPAGRGADAPVPALVGGGFA